MNLTVSVDKQGEFVIIHIHGEVDLYSSKKVREEILRQTTLKAANIIVNLADVRYMDSSGVATLIEGLQQANKYRGSFALTALQPNVKEVFELTRLDKVFDVYPDVFNAMEKLIR